MEKSQLDELYPKDLGTPTWQLVVEITLAGDLVNQYPKAGMTIDLILESLTELGFPVDVLQRISGSLGQAVHNVIGSNLQAGLFLPLIISIYTQRSLLDVQQQEFSKSTPAANMMEKAKGRLHVHSACDFQELEPQLRDGWGFFLLERTAFQPVVIDKEVHYSIEIFLYMEGQ